MNIKVTIRQLGSKKAKIEDMDFCLEKVPGTVRELIVESVKTCVSAYNLRVQSGENTAKPLTEEEISSMGEVGKIAFGINYGGKEQDLQEAVENALQSYEDGIVRIFIGDNEAGDLENTVEVYENVRVTFIRLAMLSGRMW